MKYTKDTELVLSGLRSRRIKTDKDIDRVLNRNTHIYTGEVIAKLYDKDMQPLDYTHYQDQRVTMWSVDGLTFFNIHRVMFGFTNQDVYVGHVVIYEGEKSLQHPLMYMVSKGASPAFDPGELLYTNSEKVKR